ncbi:carbohydrate ABC transporter permease [Paenibacillus yanchengensis]|uniref:Carbohydrate ABC transporter permease n=1 Tax=Paenibacillus yanchengensis TaxID=2035833 RepID=A0ABW4YGF8_9BACL
MQHIFTSKVRKKTVYVMLLVLLLLASVIALFPFLWMISASIRTDVDLFKNPMNWIPSSLYLNNYQEVWKAIPFAAFLTNTIKLSVITTVLQVFICSLAAYAFAKLKIPFKNLVFMLFMTNLMMPWHSIMVPQFNIVRELGLYDTHTGYVLIQLFSGFGIFLLRQFFMSLPNELNEAARIDGLNEWGIYWRIILPLSKPAISTLTIFTFTFMWNDYLAPLIYLQDDALKTLQLGLKLFQTEHTTDYGLLMAGTVLATIPMIVVFLIGEKFFIKGVATTGMKN